VDRKRKKKASNEEWMSPSDPDARIAKMKDGTTQLAHKAEHAVDMETGAVIAVTLQTADQGDTTTIKETLAETAENIAHLIEREAETAPDAEPQVSVTPTTEIVANKGYHSGETVLAVQRAEARSYIPEPKRQGRKWAGKAAEQKAVYANRRRVKGTYGKRLLKKRGELIERSFAHCYKTGAMRRLYLRGRENVLKRQLIHVGAFNVSLILRQTLGAGTPRELRNRQITGCFCRLDIRYLTYTGSTESSRHSQTFPASTRRDQPSQRTGLVVATEFRGGSATGC
jgi:transposase